MAYLDVSPLMVSLRNQPEEFDFRGNWLRHIPSRHSFRFDPGERVRIHAECNCAFMAIHPHQERQLTDTFESWHANYWRPLQINREFASHFRPRSTWRRVLLALMKRADRWLLGDARDHHSEARLAAE